MNNAPRCDNTLAWTALRGHYEAHGRDFDLREAFARDAGRFEAFGIEAPEVFADLSKNRWDFATFKLLLERLKETLKQTYAASVDELRGANSAGKEPP